MAAAQQGNPKKNKTSQAGKGGAARGGAPRGYKPVKKTNWFAVWVSAAVVAAVVVIGVVVVVANTAANAPVVAPTASNIDETTGAVSFGNGPDTVDSYIDFMCPYCHEFEDAVGDTLVKLASSDRITLNVIALPALDRFSQGTQYSSRSAAAFYAVAASDPAHAYAFLRAMFDNQPGENTTGLTDEQIVQIARDAGVNVTAALEQDILDQTYLGFAQQQSLPSGSSGTPTVLLNGETLNLTYPFTPTDITSRLG